jgi:hypothetical protein
MRGKRTSKSIARSTLERVHAPLPPVKIAQRVDESGSRSLPISDATVITKSSRSASPTKTKRA